MRLCCASYNVHGFVGTDGVFDVARTARAIEQLDANVVGLQEVPFERTPDGSHAPAALLALLPGYRAVCAPVERIDGVIHGNALLTTAEVARSQTLSLSFSRREPRTALEVELRIGGKSCRVITTHLGLRPVERRHQVQKLLQHVASQPAALTVLLGDFNEWFLRGRPLRWLESYFGRGRALSTYPSRWPLFALDRIWVHPRHCAVSYRVAQGKSYVATSDHLPLIAELQLA